MIARVDGRSRRRLGGARHHRQPADDLAQYSEMIPVTFIDGVQHDFWRVSEDRLRAALRESADRHPSRRSGDGIPGQAPRPDSLRAGSGCRPGSADFVQTFTRAYRGDRESRAGIRPVCAHVESPGVPAHVSPSLAGQSKPARARPVRAGDRAPARTARIPDATVARLPVYLRALYALADHDVATCPARNSPPPPG